MTEYPPSVPLARLYERTSKKGNTYLSGYMGLAKVTALKSNETDKDGNPIWHLLVAESPQRGRPAERAVVGETGETKSEMPMQSRAAKVKRDWQRPAGQPQATSEPSEQPASNVDDLIPF